LKYQRNLRNARSSISKAPNRQCESFLHCRCTYTSTDSIYSPVSLTLGRSPTRANRSIRLPRRRQLNDRRCSTKLRLSRELRLITVRRCTCVPVPTLTTDCAYASGARRQRPTPDDGVTVTAAAALLLRHCINTRRWSSSSRINLDASICAAFALNDVELGKSADEYLLPTAASLNPFNGFINSFFTTCQCRHQ